MNVARRPKATTSADADTDASELHYPPVHTVRGRILGALLRGDQLTQKDTLRRFSDFRLSAHVDALKNRGWATHSEMIKVGTKDAGRKSDVARYSLTADAIVDAGAEGQQYGALTLAIEMQRAA